jgi:hypothetical protein
MGQHQNKPLRRKVSHVYNNNNPPTYYYFDSAEESEEENQDQLSRQKDIELWFDKKIFEDDVNALYKQGDMMCFKFVQFDGSTRIDTTIYEQLPSKHAPCNLPAKFFQDYYERYGDDVEPIPPEQEAKYDRIVNPQKRRGNEKSK